MPLFFVLGYSKSQKVDYFFEMSHSSILNDLPVLPSAESFALTEAYNLDTFPEKVNLGQGVYRDEECQPWVLPSVRSVGIANEFCWAPSHSITGRGVPTQATSQPRISSNTRSRRIHQRGSELAFQSSTGPERKYKECTNSRWNGREPPRCAILCSLPAPQTCIRFRSHLGQSSSYLGDCRAGYQAQALPLL